MGGAKQFSDFEECHIVMLSRQGNASRDIAMAIGHSKFVATALRILRSMELRSTLKDQKLSTLVTNYGSREQSILLQECLPAKLLQKP